jgi:cytidylate kinase
MNLAISGWTASGKTYQAKRIAEKLGLGYISGSDILVKKAGVNVPQNSYFWIQECAERLNERRKSDQSIDIETDEALLELAGTRENIVFDSWTLPWLYTGEGLYRVYLAANLEARARNAYNSREEKPFSMDELLERLQKRDEYNARLFQELYGINIPDYSYFQLIIDNSDLLPEETTCILVETARLELKMQLPLLQ